MTNEEISLKKLERRVLTTYAGVQFAFYCRLKALGDRGEEPLKHLREAGFDVETREDGTFKLIEIKQEQS